MKKTFTLFVTMFICLSAIGAGSDIKWKRIEVSELGILGKAFDTPNPYHRIDTCVYKGFTTRENDQCRCPAGLSAVFRTDAERIAVSLEFGDFVAQDAYNAYRGFDLYIKKDGKWLWAGCCTFATNHKGDTPKVLVKSLPEGTKECLLYLPIYSEVTSCQLCVPEGSRVETMESPFRHRILFHGSSFTQGSSCTRSGMSYPVQFMRRTGMQPITLGFGGNCRMQPYFLEVMKDIEADAYIFDAFSNPTTQVIIERFPQFVDELVKAHPGKPIIFQRTIYWERENFDTAAQAKYQGQRDIADNLMKQACQKYKDVYYVIPDAALHNGESSTADGTHPNDHGYSIWEASIEKPILRILRKYGIK